MGKINASDLVAYLLYVTTLIASIRTLMQFTEQFQRGMTGIERFDEIMCLKPEIIDKENALPLENIPVGTIIHNIELMPGKGAQLVRAAGNSAQLMAKEGKYAQVRLPSGEVRMIRMDCIATIGQVGNLDHENISIGKAGRKRHMGWRPTVRGVVMNPCDHPHGGGEGKSPIGRPSRIDMHQTHAVSNHQDYILYFLTLRCLDFRHIIRVFHHVGMKFGFSGHFLCLHRLGNLHASQQ